MEIELLTIFRKIIWDVLSKKAIAKVMALLVINPSGVLGTIVLNILAKISEKAFEWVALEIKLESIKVVNEIHQSQFERAQLKLKLIARNSGIESDEFKKARVEEHEKLVKVVVFNFDPTVVRIGKAA